MDFDLPHGGNDPPLRVGFERGLHFFVENGEKRADGQTPRVVGVGTHARRRLGRFSGED